MRGARRVILAAVVATASLVAGAVILPEPVWGVLLPAAAPVSGSIAAEQAGVVTLNHQGPISVAEYAVAQYGSEVEADQRAVDADSATQASATTLEEAATARLGGDRAALAAAVTAVTDAEARVAGDRARLRALAIGVYTGALTNPQPASVDALEADQERIIDSDEVGIVAHVVSATLGSDLATSATATRTRAAAAERVATDEKTAASAGLTARAAEVRTATDTTRLNADDIKLAGAEATLGAARADLASALVAVAGPSSVPAGQLSLMGASALSAEQLAGWFNQQGYADLTSASIDQLASWYIEWGAEEGIRGDVAFAQAVLETGGFSSPDAVDLSNFAGIGHCDSCAAGWSFPSPQGGVLGQIQLLRIFAGGGNSAGAAPVLPQITTAHQFEAGCCAGVQSLTGVWATDPTYGTQILGIYGSMLEYALGTSPAISGA